MLYYIYIYNIYIYICHENNVPPGYHHNGFVATQALGHMVHGVCICILLVPKNQRLLSKLSKKFNISGHK